MRGAWKQLQRKIPEQRRKAETFIVNTQKRLNKVPIQVLPIFADDSMYDRLSGTFDKLHPFLFEKYTV